MSRAKVERPRPRGPLVLFGATSLLSAGLLFWVQPLFGRLLLPHFGGAAAVWSACLLFFQGMLLAGYAYAHGLERLPWPAPRRLALHGLVLLLPLAVLPIALRTGWVAADLTRPVPSLLALLLVSVGPGFFVLSTTAPLLQRWYSRLGADPYPLYAASNFGSMVALLGYPFVIEPLWSLSRQRALWSAGYGLFVLAVLGCGWLLVTRGRALPEPPAPAARDKRPDARTRLQWLGLSFVPASLVYGVTTMLGTDVAAVPLLWVVPLALYLMTFVWAFAAPGDRHGGPLAPRSMPSGGLLVPPLLAVMTITFLLNISQPAWFFLLLHLAGFTATAYALHRELARRRPPVHHLTEYYLWISAGGLAAGLFNVIAAPRVFDAVLEYPLGLLLAWTVLCGLPAARGSSGGAKVARVIALAVAFVAIAGLLALGAGSRFLTQRLAADALALALTLGIAAAFALRLPLRLAAAAAAVLLVHFVPEGGDLLHLERSFFGVHKILDRGTRVLYQHGTTDHGQQSKVPALRRLPLSYFFPTGPIGQTFQALGQARLADVGVVGLGAGTLAAYAVGGQHWTFFEIDPVVRRIASDSAYFSYLADAAAPVRIVIDDGRLALAREPERRFDLLVIDAFSSDAIPVHLFTTEAFALYVSRLKPSGVLALHVTNRFLRLEPVAAAIARELGLVGLAQSDGTLSPRERALGKSASQWLMLARARADLGALAYDSRWHTLATTPSARAWTDDHVNVLGALHLEQ